MKWNCFSLHFSSLLIKKITSLLQPTHLYKFVSISIIFSSFSLSHFLPSIFFLVFLFISNSKRVTIAMCMFKNSSSSNAKTYINYYFIFLVSHLLLVLLLSVLLVFSFFIIYFYIIHITYKYNKLLLTWQKCMISNLIILVYAFNSCCLTYFIMVLDYCII